MAAVAGVERTQRLEVDPHPQGAIVGDLHLRVLGCLTPDVALETLSRLAEMDCSIEASLESMRLAQRAAARAAWVEARHAARLATADLFRAEDAHGEVDAASEEISLTLGVTRTQAERLVQVGRVAITDGPLLDAGTALHAGDITFEVAWEFVRALTPVSLEVALAVEAEVLPEAPGHTPGEVRSAIARALIEIDPNDADARHARARATRGVTRPHPLPDGMARVSAFLPADDAVALDTALDAAAVAAHTAGDHRTTSQLRADTLAAWAATALQHGTDVTLESGETVHSHPTKVAVTVPLEVMLRALPSFTPPPSVGDVLAADIAGIAPDVDLADGAAPGPATGLASGHRTEAAVLEGYGPIAPVIALLLATGGTWQRIVTDTLTGRPLDVGRTRYTPPADLATALRVRDQHCTRPGCATAARNCDRDHVHEWADGGATSADNLTHLCRHHHRLKSVNLARPGPADQAGERTWKTVTGRSHTPMRARPPRKRAGPPLGENAPPPEPSQFDGPPPF
jgi:hypothetical protein